MLAPFIPIEELLDPRRKELRKLIDSIFDSLPGADMPLESAVKQGYITKEQADEFYASLTSLLSDPDYRRLIFYLPFELLPGAPDEFKQAYMAAWRRLLWVSDVRANFVDGDILEKEQQVGTLPRVVKAAHLIPKLVDAGWMDVGHAITIMEDTNYQILKESIAEALAVLGEIKPRKKQIKQEPSVITEKRRAWLAQREREKTITILEKDGARLARPLSENLKLISQELADIEKMVASIKLNPELSRLIYPVVSVFGSRLNGYGNHDSDIDIAVFVKPGTPFANRAKLQELLKKNFAYPKIRADDIVQFWLDNKSYWANALFCAVWIGDKDSIDELYEKLLMSYMRADDSARRIYLEDIEKAVLQYRLMHKGYRRFFAPCGLTHTPHNDEIDGDSVFWDSGYRWLATKLFISRVFLPKLNSLAFQGWEIKVKSRE